MIIIVLYQHVIVKWIIIKYVVYNVYIMFIKYNLKKSINFIS